MRVHCRCSMYMCVIRELVVGVLNLIYSPAWVSAFNLPLGACCPPLPACCPPLPATACLLVAACLSDACLLTCLLLVACCLLSPVTCTRLPADKPPLTNCNTPNICVSLPKAPKPAKCFVSFCKVVQISKCTGRRPVNLGQITRVAWTRRGGWPFWSQPPFSPQSGLHQFAQLHPLSLHKQSMN